MERDNIYWWSAGERTAWPGGSSVTVGRAAGNRRASGGGPAEYGRTGGRTGDQAPSTVRRADRRTGVRAA